MPGWKTWTSEVLAASDLNDKLMGQAVPRFATEAARDAAITGPDGYQMSSADDAGLTIYQADNIASARWIKLWTPWADFSSPSWSSGITTVDGTWDAVRRFEGGAIHIRAQYTIGASDSVTGVPIFDASGYLTSAATHISLGAASLRDTSASLNLTATARCGIGSQGVNILYTSAISSTVPFTWASGDLILFDIVLVHPDIDAQ